MKVCLISSQHISYNPRLVKEADTLFEAGYDVRVVAIRNLTWMAEEDQKLLKKRGWKLEFVDYDPSTRRGQWLWLKSGFRQKLARLFYKAGIVHWNCAEYALGRVYSELRKLAAKEPADLFIAHTLPALPVAAWAAQQYEVKLGFDIEDLHSEERSNIPEHAFERSLIIKIERSYLPHCAYITVSSPLIGEEMIERYHVFQPTVVLNVFSRPSSSDFVLSEKKRALSIYWFSQVIGPGRGLEDAIAAVARSKGLIELHLQGQVCQVYARKLHALLKSLKIGNSVFFHPPVAPDEIIFKAANYDVGLALERKEPLNRDICITNKIFIYMSAGLAIAATHTRGQRTVLEKAPKAGFLYEPGDVDKLVEGLNNFIRSPEALHEAKIYSLKAATDLYNLKIEQKKFLEAVRKVIQ